MGKDEPRRDEIERNRALRDLDRLAQESDPRHPLKIGDHGPTKQGEVRREEENDPIERWGQMIGKALSFVLLIGLLWYLAATYL